MTQPNAFFRWSLPVLGRIVGSITLFAIAPEAQAASFNYNAFQGDLTSIDLVGDVKTDGATLRLTEAEQEWRAAAAWHNESQDITGGFETTFSFQISDLRAADDLYNGKSAVIDRNGEIGGDGFAFVIRNQASSALGGYGGALGYSGITDALAIEFDTWDNSQDFEDHGGGVVEDYGLESSNHIGVQGLTSGSYGEYPRYSLGYADDIANLSSGEVHEAKIRYEGNRLSVFLNSALALEVEDLDLSGLVGAEDAILGFTAGTGASWQRNEILSWSYEELDQSQLLKQPIQAVPEPSGLLALLSLGGAAAWKQRSHKQRTAIASTQKA